MARMGLLEAMAQADLDAMLESVAAGYRPGAAEALEACEPGWRTALELKEREVGELYAALCEVDHTVRRWRQAVAELERMWARVREVPAAEPVPLREVA